MEALSLSPRKLSSADLLIAVTASILAHGIILFVVLLLPQLMPRQSRQVSFYTVNLVNSNDLKDSFVPPIKGKKSTAGNSKKSAATKSSNKPSSSSETRTSSPLVPVKRLQFDETPKKSAEGLKKLETSELPKIAAHTENTDSIEKDLDKLTKKPKTATSAPPAGESARKSAAPAKETSAAVDSSATEPEGKSKQSEAVGHPEGSRNGSNQASAGGAQVGLARRLYYTEIWNAIRSNWALPDFLKDKSLEAVLVVTVRRDGKILGLRFEKRSGNALFDDSAERAVMKADPLPPFPAIYSPPQEEIGVRFRPEDLY